MSIDLHNVRKDFTRNPDIDHLESNPVTQFKYWLQDAIDASTIDATAFALSTATKDGIPSSRILLLKGVDDNGFHFFTHYESQKAKEIAENPIATILFFWARTERQVRILGKIEKVSSTESDTYFNIRPKDSQVNAIISPQSEPIPNRDFLLKKREELLLSNQELTRPKNWGGYCLSPRQYEFWQGGANRLHHRYVYKKTQLNEWDISMIAP